MFRLLSKMQTLLQKRKRAAELSETIGELSEQLYSFTPSDGCSTSTAQLLQKKVELQASVQSLKCKVEKATKQLASKKISIPEVKDNSLFDSFSASSAIMQSLRDTRVQCDKLHDDALELRQNLVSRRQRLLYELTHAFEIVNTGVNGRRALRNLTVTPTRELTDSLNQDGQLPPATPGEVEDEDAALGYCALLINEIAKVTDVPLRLSPHHAGSRSYVWDLRGVASHNVNTALSMLQEATPGVVLGGALSTSGGGGAEGMEGDSALLLAALAEMGAVRLPLHRSSPDAKQNLLLQSAAAAVARQNLSGGTAGEGVNQGFGGEGALYVAGQQALLSMVAQLHARQGFDATKATGILESLEVYFNREVWVPEAKLNSYI